MLKNLALSIMLGGAISPTGVLPVNMASAQFNDCLGKAQVRAGLQNGSILPIAAIRGAAGIGGRAKLAGLPKVCRAGGGNLVYIFSVIGAGGKIRSFVLNATNGLPYN
jgi:hypothetical protein